MNLSPGVPSVVVTRASQTMLGLVTTGVALLAGISFAQSRDSGMGRALGQDRDSIRRPSYVCGTRLPSALDARGLAALGPLPDGKPIYYRQTPTIIRPDISTSIGVEVTVLGDVSSLGFKRYDPEKGSPTETWQRTGTGVARGRVVSFFAKTWPASEFARILRRTIHGYDYPEIFWGEVLTPNRKEKSSLTLRVGFTNLPSSPVNRISGTVQYSSHVVNLVIPDFGDTRITGGDYAFDQEAVAREFYKHFQDAYHVLAIAPQIMHFAPFGAFHDLAKNEVRGINIEPFNRSAIYGSGGRLEGVEVFAQTGFAEHDTANHELTHQWGHNLNWAGIAGVRRAGHQPTLHAPLWAFGETTIGAVLEPSRRVKASAAGGYEIERQTFPTRQHPIDMYLMGKLTVSQVPDMFIFENQAQFEAGKASEPKIGTKLKGAVRKVSINDILRQHGPRTGPVPGTYRRALIYVSRTLATQDEMNYLNFLTQRQEDPRRVGVMSYDGFASFDVTTRNTVDLKTDVTPLAAPKLTRNLAVDFPVFGKSDWRGVVFDQPVPSRYTAGSTVTVSGKVMATDRDDFDQISLIFVQADGAGEVRFDTAVSRAGSFSTAIRFNARQKGAYWIDLYLFWDGASAQYPRSSLSPVHVQ